MRGARLVGLTAAMAAQWGAAGTVQAEPPPIVGPFLLPGDAEIVPAASRQETPAIAAGGAGYLVAWTDSRTNFDSLPPFVEEQGARDVVAARLDADGALLDTFPIPVSQEYGWQRGPAVSWNGESWLVVWENQSPTEWFHASEILAARVAPDGTLLDAAPISIHAFASSSTAYHAVTGDGSGWLVVYEGSSAGENGIYGVRVAADGTVLDPDPVELVAATFFLHFDVSVHRAGGEYLLVYTASGEPTARRFTTDLAPLGSFQPPGVLVASNGTSHYVAWTADGSLVGSPMALDGTLARPGGVTIVAPGSAVGADLTWDGVTWWAAWRDGAEGLEVGRITTAGDVLDPGGVPFDPALAGGMRQHRVAGGPAGGVQLAWQDSRRSGANPEDIHVGGYDAGAVPGSDAPISLGTRAQRGAELIAGPGHFLVAFRSESSGETRVLVQRVDAAGRALDAEPVEVARGDLGMPAAAFNGSHYLVTWAADGKILGRRMADDGTFLDPMPVPLMPGLEPAVAARGTEFLVVGTHHTFDIEHWRVAFAVRVDGATGRPIDAEPLQLGQVYAREPRVVALPDGWLAAWSRHPSHDDPQSHVSAAFIGADGTSAGEFAVAWNAGTPALATSDETVLFAYRINSRANANNDVGGRVMLLDGSFPAEAFVISSATGRQFAAAAAWTGASYLVCWEDKRNGEAFFDERTDVYALRVGETGGLLDAASFPVAAERVPETEVAIASDGADTLVAMSHYVPGAPHASYRIGLSHVDAAEGLDAGDVGDSLRLLERHRLAWSPPAGGAASDIARGLLSDLRGGPGYAAAVELACLVPQDTFVDPELPPEGDGFFYVVRAHGGTWGSGGRDAGIAACP